MKLKSKLQEVCDAYTIKYLINKINELEKECAKNILIIPNNAIRGETICDSEFGIGQTGTCFPGISITLPKELIGKKVSYIVFERSENEFNGQPSTNRV